MSSTKIKRRFAKRFSATIQRKDVTGEGEEMAEQDGDSIEFSGYYPSARQATRASVAMSASSSREDAQAAFADRFEIALDVVAGSVISIGGDVFAEIELADDEDEAEVRQEFVAAKLSAVEIVALAGALINPTIGSGSAKVTGEGEEKSVTFLGKSTISPDTRRS